MRRARSVTPFFCQARFPGKCPETGKDIKRGDRIAYFPAERRAYHETSKAAEQVRGLQFASSWAMADANY